MKSIKCLFKTIPNTLRIFPNHSKSRFGLHSMRSTRERLVYLSIDKNTDIRMYTYIYIYLHVCVYMFYNMNVYVCVYIYIYTNTVRISLSINDGDDYDVKNTRIEST